jgi:hypothetical protein
MHDPEPFDQRLAQLAAQQAALEAQMQVLKARVDEVCTGLLEELRKRFGLPPED